MPVTDLPPGEWTALLIGDQWPSSNVVEAIQVSVRSRALAASNFKQHAELTLNTVANLSSQRGITAADVLAEFHSGATHSEEISQTNSIKSGAYRNVYERVVELRNSLRAVAEHGNAAIESISRSKMPLALRIAEIQAIILRSREDAFVQAASCAGHIGDQVRTVLSAQGFGNSPQAFASEQGVGVTVRSSTDSEDLQAQISRQLGQLNSASADMQPGGPPPSLNSPSRAIDIGTTADAAVRPASDLIPATTGSPDRDESPMASAKPEPQPDTITALASVATPIDAPPSAAHERLPETITAAAAIATPVDAPPSIKPTPPHESVPDNITAAASISTPAAMPSTHSYAGEEAPRTPLLMTPPLPVSSDVTSVTASANPGAFVATGTATVGHPFAGLSESLSSGNQAGTPLTKGAEAISALTASQVHITPAPPGPTVDPIAPAVPVFETANAAQPHIPDITHPSPAMPEVSHTVLATTPAAVTPTAPPVSIGPTAVPAATPPGALIAYGADLRAPAAATAATPPAPIAAPSSAPINAASGVGSSGQPTVVRQPASSASPLTAGPGLTERALAATAAGATIGAIEASKVAEQRLRRLLAAVARQQPQLRWAIGDLENGETLLVTDLAGGWVPPGIDIPTDVRLPQPSDGRKSITALLGATLRTAIYEPGQYLPPDDLPVATSIRARDTAAVDDLGWALAQATRWRDGLPRLAHTLTRAVSAKTGCLESEVSLLSEHLTAVTRSVLARYPTNANPAEVGNWQLLATIDALINDQRTLANYHFTWFQAQAGLPEGHP